MIMKSPKVSIITVNYKQPKVTTELLDSINKLDYPNLEVIVVDNAQMYDDTLLFQKHFGETQVINVKENTGFAKGNNIGIKASTGDYILLLNNDTEIENGVIESLLERFATSEEIGAISPIIRYHDHPDKIQFAGFTEVSKFTGRNELIRLQPEVELSDTAYFHGAAVMIPRAVISNCGLMPEEFFLYYEELDWSRVIKENGYALKVLSTVSVLHKESISTGKNSPLKVYYQNRNRIHFMRKAAKQQYLLFLTYFLLLAAPKNFLVHLCKREFKHLKAFTKALYHGLIVKRVGFQKF